ncbi:MAG: sensor histidine kinase [Myxococcota bacterium]|nr:sensor histidine kinase [Myxococcota bacterium]
MSFADFIEQNREQIIREWVSFASERIPSTKGMSEIALRDHAGELLQAVVEDMKTPQTAAQTHEKSQGLDEGGRLASVGHHHASERLAGGFDIEHLLSEFRALRASVLRLWSEEHGEDHEETTRFSEAIDESLTASVVRYSQTLQRTREQFLAMLGHDLRSPLSAITMGAAALARAEELDDAHARIAMRILSSAHRMSRMVADLLDFARTRLGEAIPIVRRPTDLGVVCRAIMEEHAVVHPGCRLRLQTHGDLVGEWDADRLTQLVSNLVANAIQHGKEHGEVTVRAEGRGDRVEVRVHNTSEPISESVLRHIFEPLVRGPSGDGNRNATGLGLGLYIAQQIVAAHGGTIDVTSTAEDGTAFVVDLARQVPAPAE